MRSVSLCGRAVKPHMNTALPYDCRCKAVVNVYGLARAVVNVYGLARETTALLCKKPYVKNQSRTRKSHIIGYGTTYMHSVTFQMDRALILLYGFI